MSQYKSELLVLVSKDLRESCEGSKLYFAPLPFNPAWGGTQSRELVERRLERLKGAGVRQSPLHTLCNPVSVTRQWSRSGKKITIDEILGFLAKYRQFQAAPPFGRLRTGGVSQGKTSLAGLM